MRWGFPLDVQFAENAITRAAAICFTERDDHARHAESEWIRRLLTVAFSADFRHCNQRIL